MRIIKLLLFHLALSFRGLILGMSKILSLIFLGSFCMVISISELNHIPIFAKAALLALGIIFTLINWFYDYLVLHLQPNSFNIRLCR